MGATTPMTADELFRMSDDGCRRELVSGELKMMAPVGFEHGEVMRGPLPPLFGRRASCGAAP